MLARPVASSAVLWATRMMEHCPDARPYHETTEVPGVFGEELEILESRAGQQLNETGAQGIVEHGLNDVRIVDGP